MLSFDINWLAVLVATIAYMAIGSLWYSPLLFGDRWMKAVGKRREELGSPTGSMTLTAACALVMAFALAVLSRSLGVPGLLQGALLGVLVGLGFVATGKAVSGAFEGSSSAVVAIFVGYQLVALLVMGAIFGLWV